MKKMRSKKGITLVALVVTIIVLIILAGISINLLLGENGLITKAQEAKKQQKIAEIKEKISLELASAETDAIIRNESLEEEQLNDIVSKYGTLKDDKDTILTKDDNYKISLKEIWYGTLSTSGSYSDKKKQIELLEKELKELQDKYNELEQINSGNSEVLNDLRNQITTLENKNKTLETQMADLNSKYDNLKKEYDKFFNDPGTATAGDIAVGKTAWVNGNLITGQKTNNDVTLEVSSLSYRNPFTITGLKKGDLIRASISNNHWDKVIYMYINNISGAEVISQQVNDTTGASNATLYLRATSSTVKFTIGCDERYQSWNPLQLILVKHI